MNLLVDRIFLGDSYTIGKLYIDGEYFCDTLEDTVRDLGPDGSGKIYGETAIPSGEYAIALTRSPRFKRILPRLLNVPFFEGILIHSGNSAKSSSGCLLVGKNSKKGMVLESRKYETLLVQTLQEAVNRGEKITITIKD